jgi:hypothetical protein
MLGLSPGSFGRVADRPLVDGLEGMRAPMGGLAVDGCG